MEESEVCRSLRLSLGDAVLPPVIEQRELPHEVLQQEVASIHLGEDVEELLSVTRVPDADVGDGGSHLSQGHGALGPVL